MTVVVTPLSLGALINSASISRAEADADPNNNTASEITIVGTPTLFINDVSVKEGDSGVTNAAFTVVLSPPAAKTVLVNYATVGGTASVGTDYRSTNGTLVFLPGETNKTVSVPVLGDIIWEFDETFLVNLSNPSNAVLGRSQAVGTIANDDVFPSVSLSNAMVTEGNVGTTNAVFTVSLYPPSSQQVSFYYYTSDGSAVSPSDYLSIGSTFVSLNPGQTNVSIAVQVNGDFNIEPDEMFYLYIYGLNNANYVNSQAVGTIVNDDGLPGQVDHFAWEHVPSPQYSGAPFPVSVTARDPSNVLVTNFTGAVTISGYPGAVGISANLLGNLGNANSNLVDATIGYAFTPNTNFVVTHVRHYYGTKVSIWTDGGALVASRKAACFKRSVSRSLRTRATSSSRPSVGSEAGRSQIVAST